MNNAVKGGWKLTAGKLQKAERNRHVPHISFS
jgi:hypothetical protein